MTDELSVFRGYKRKAALSLLGNLLFVIEYFKPVCSENVKIWPVTSQFSPQDGQLGLGSPLLLVKRFIRFLLDIAGAGVSSPWPLGGGESSNTCGCRRLLPCQPLPLQTLRYVKSCQKACENNALEPLGTDFDSGLFPCTRMLVGWRDPLVRWDDLRD